MFYKDIQAAASTIEPSRSALEYRLTRPLPITSLGINGGIKVQLFLKHLNYFAKKKKSDGGKSWRIHHTINLCLREWFQATA